MDGETSGAEGSIDRRDKPACRGGRQSEEVKIPGLSPNVATAISAAPPASAKFSASSRPAMIFAIRSCQLRVKYSLACE
jgi:hypothetical protein